MTREYRNQKERRSWSLARRLGDLDRRERQRAHLVRMVRRPVTQDETLGMAREEAEVVNYLRGASKPWVHIWKMLNELATGENERERRPKRQALLSLVSRMLRERKILRHRASNSVSLAIWLRVPSNQEITADWTRTS